MAEARTILDAKGRKITLRPHPDVILTMDILEAAGVDAKGRSVTQFLNNDRWMGYATLACYVSAIDDVPTSMPTHAGQIKALVGQLGTEGIAAISDALSAADEAAEVNMEAAKNSAGTPQ